MSGAGELWSLLPCGRQDRAVEATPLTGHRGRCYLAPMTTTTETTGPVEAWACTYQGTHRCPRTTVGKTPKRCPACKGTVSTSTVYITVQPWRADARYTLETATHVYRSMPAAERKATELEQVVRLIHR